MSRVINFNAGPAALPLAALETAQREFLDIDGSGMSIMEHSHRGAVYNAIHEEALALVRELLRVPESYEVLLLQGGATQQFAVVPMNLLSNGKCADYVITGSWSKKAIAQARAVGDARAILSVEQDGKFCRIPKVEEIQPGSDAAYLHLTSNNTIAGTQWRQFPELSGVPLVVDMSSDIMWRPLDVKQFGLIYAGAQKNLGPSGVTLVIARKGLIEAGREDIPAIFSYRTHAKAKSLSNTPPTFAIYMLRNVLRLLKSDGGLVGAEKRNREKAKMIYDAIARRADFYRCPVEESSRSMMNIVFNLPTSELEQAFVKRAEEAGMVGLKGHRSVGGIRVSTYNAGTKVGAEKLSEFMDRFEA